MNRLVAEPVQRPIDQQLATTENTLSTTVPPLTQQLVVFALGEEEYALPITQVQEIIRYSTPRAIASEHDWMRGVISLRGRIVPVCELSRRLGVAGDVASEAKIVIVETSGGIVGVVVDSVREVLTVETGQLETVPGAGPDFIDAVAKVGDRLLILLNSEGLFAGIELAE